MDIDALYALAHHSGRSAAGRDAETKLWFRSLCDTSGPQSAGFMDGLAVTAPESPYLDAPWGAVAVTCVGGAA